MKIAHISDLHFCDPTLAPKLEGFQRGLRAELAEVFPIDFAFDFADEDVLSALKQWLGREAPDLIIVSGDITTFGDIKSFQIARKWLNDLKPVAGGGERPVIVVPGNHDVLCYQFTQLRKSILKRLRDLPWPASWFIKRRINGLLSLFDGCLEAAGSSGDDTFDNFRRFLDEGSFIAKSSEYAVGSSFSIVVHPFCSVSTDPVWMNSGVVRTQDWNRVRSGIESLKDAPGKLHVAVIHHNPLSSPDVVESAAVYGFNGMPGGTDYLKTMQSMGVDLVVHGHQHLPLVVKFDFDLNDAGHAYCLGVPSSATKGTEKHPAGCRLLEIEHINEVKLKTFEYNGKGYFVEGQPKVLPLERHRPADAKTVAARYELKRYVYFTTDSDETDKQSKELWDEAVRPGAKLIYMSGRKARSIARGREKDIVQLLQHGDQHPCRIRILLSDPDLLELLIAPSKDSKDETERVNHLWGRKENLKRLANDARESLQELKQIVDGLPAELRRHIDVRTAHTVLPFAATVRDPRDPWAKMVVRILPVGAIGELVPPVLKLNRRESAALFDYYNDHLRYLLSLGTHRFGDWPENDKDDLILEGLSPQGHSAAAP